MLDRTQAGKMRRLLDHWGNTMYYIRSKEEEVTELRAAIDDAYLTLGAQNLDGMPRGSGAHSSVERANEAAQHRIDCYAEALERIQADVRKALRMKAAIDEVVNDLSATEQKVLCYRYKEGKTWERIARMLHYDVSRVKVKEREAIEVLAGRIEIQDETRLFL